MRLLPLPRILVSLFVLFSCAEASAHPGHVHPVNEVDEFDDEAISSAVGHPFTRTDDLLAMLAAAGGMLSLCRLRRLGQSDSPEQRSSSLACR